MGGGEQTAVDYVDDLVQILIDAARRGDDETLDHKLGVFLHITPPAIAIPMVKALLLAALGTTPVVPSDWPADEHEDGRSRQIRPVDVERLSDMCVAVSNRADLTEEQATRVWVAAFTAARDDAYGPAGALWAVQNLLSLAVGNLTHELTGRIAREDADAMDTLRAALDEIRRGDV